MGVAQNENEMLKGDNMLNRREMEDQMRTYKQNEQGLEARIQRTENEY